MARVKKDADGKEKVKRPVGKPPKYQPEELERAVEKYFKRCIKAEYVVDADGEAVLDEDGDALTRETIYREPDFSDMLYFLDLTRDTWNDYAHKDAYSHTVTRAMKRLESRLSRKLHDGSLSSTRGVEFALKCNYGWRDVLEIDVGDKTLKAVAEMSLAERVAALKSAIKDDAEE